MVCKDVTFISEEQIHQIFWREAYELVHNIDIKDVQYIAYAKQFKCKIWSGDKKLIKGLKEKGYFNLITTDELFELRAKKQASL